MATRTKKTYVIARSKKPDHRGRFNAWAFEVGGFHMTDPIIDFAGNYDVLTANGQIVGKWERKAPGLPASRLFVSETNQRWRVFADNSASEVVE